MHKPFFMYESPMFSVTVSTVVIIENGVIVIREDDKIRFPMTTVKAGQETIPFASVRNLKEETGITVKKGDLIPVDFRSDPSRSDYGNVIDIGMMYFPEMTSLNRYTQYDNAQWIEVDFEKKEMVQSETMKLDHNELLKRSITLVVLMKE